MRRVRRRRPAGQPQVPVVIGEPVVCATVVTPAVVRIGPDRSLLDPPWNMAGCTVAHIWLDAASSGGLARAVWPREPWSNRPIAPLDLHLGHALELSMRRVAALEVRYACVADADPQHMVLVSAASAAEAISMARRAVDVWQAAQLVATEDAWRERIEAAQRFSGEAV